MSFRLRRAGTERAERVIKSFCYRPYVALWYMRYHGGCFENLWCKFLRFSAWMFVIVFEHNGTRQCVVGALGFVERCGKSQQTCLQVQSIEMCLHPSVHRVWTLHQHSGFNFLTCCSLHSHFCEANWIDLIPQLVELRFSFRLVRSRTFATDIERGSSKDHQKKTLPKKPLRWKRPLTKKPLRWKISLVEKTLRKILVF